jgi:hypothetical protein
MDARDAYIHILEAELVRCHRSDALLHPSSVYGYPIEYSMAPIVSYPCTKCGSEYALSHATCVLCERQGMICMKHTDWDYVKCCACLAIIYWCPTHVNARDTYEITKTCEHCYSQIIYCKSCSDVVQTCTICAKSFSTCVDCIFFGRCHECQNLPDTN